MTATTQVTHVLSCNRCGGVGQRMPNQDAFQGAFGGERAQVGLSVLNSMGGMIISPRSLDLCTACTVELRAFLEAGGPL